MRPELPASLTQTMASGVYCSLRRDRKVVTPRGTEVFSPRALRRGRSRKA